MFVRKNPVLLLNADYSFLTTINIKRSISLFLRGKVKILKSSDFMMHPSLNFKRPDVLVLTEYKNIPQRCRKIKLTRESIMLRDGYTCQYTGKKLTRSEIEIDHVIPKSRGGKNTWDNLVVASPDVNNLKADRTPEEAGLKLIRKPYEPTLFDFIDSLNRDDWKEFISEVSFV